MRKASLLTTLVMVSYTFTLFASGDSTSVKEFKQESIFKRFIKNELVIGKQQVDGDTTKKVKPFPLSFGFDFYSRYIWRGVDFGNAPSIQPSISYSVGDKVSWEIGAWGAYATNGSYGEFDLYTTLNFPYVYIGGTDYFFPVDTAGSDNQYYNYTSDKTGHVIEAIVGFDLSEIIPLSGFVTYNAFGADKDNSMYYELKYAIVDGIDIFVGAAHGAYYTQSGKAMVTNVGITVSREIKIGNHFALPLSATIGTNPDRQNVFFAAGFGLWGN